MKVHACSILMVAVLAGAVPASAERYGFRFGFGGSC